jgi:hypothetical protein
MGIKGIVKNLLPYFIVSGYLAKKTRSAAGLKNSAYLEMGNSVLLDNFSIETIDSLPGKRVVVGTDNMLDCQILFESAEGHVTIGDRVYIGNTKIICRSKIMIHIPRIIR